MSADLINKLMADRRQFDWQAWRELYDAAESRYRYPVVGACVADVLDLLNERDRYRTALLHVCNSQEADVSVYAEDCLRVATEALRGPQP